MDYLVPGGKVISTREEIGPRTRRTIHVNEVPARGYRRLGRGELQRARRGREVDLLQLLRDHRRHQLDRVTSPASQWYMAEGFTAQGFDTYILLENPTGTDGSAKVDFMLATGRSSGWCSRCPRPLAGP